MNFYVTELDNKPIIGGGWYDTAGEAISAARASVTNAPEATYVAVTGAYTIEVAVARQDHPNAAQADEIQVSPELSLTVADFHIGQRVKATQDIGTLGRGSEGIVTGFQNYEGRMRGTYVEVRFDTTPGEAGGECMLPSEIEAVTA